MASLSNINGIFDVHSTGAIQFNGNHGTAGQILRSNGNAAPTWVAASTVIGGPYLPLTGGTLTGNLAINGTNTLTVGGALTVTGNQYFNGSFIEGDGKEMFRYSDSWLRINEDLDFADGIYCGTGILRTDGVFQIGSGGGSLTVTAAGVATFAGNVQAPTFNGLAINTTGTNNLANQIVRTEANGYVNFGWINSVSGATTATITRITASNDAYLRYVTPATFRTQVTDPYYAPAGTVTGVTSVATGNGITGGTITTTGTVSLTGNYTGRWNGTTGYFIKDTRGSDITPADSTDHAMNLGFTNQVPGNGNWQSYIQMKGWSDGYTSWQIIGPSTTTAYENWYLRSGLGSTWNTAKQIWHSGNFTPGNYLPLSGGTMTGGLNMGSQNITNATNIYSNSWFRNNNSGTGLYNQATYNHWYSDGNYWNVGYSGTTGIRLRNGHAGTIMGYLYGETSGEFGLLDKDGQWTFRTNGVNVTELRCNNTIGFVMNASGQITLSSTLTTNGGITANNELYLKDRITLPASALSSVSGRPGYAIYQEGGAWASPFPDLCIAMHTGIKFGAYAGYNGMRFYDDYTMATQVMSINNGSDGLGAGNVYVNNSLQAGSSLRAPIFYDSNNTAYYGNFAGTSIMTRINVGNGNGPAIQIGPNTSYGAGTEIEIGGWTSDTSVSRIRNSNGNLHIDSKNGHNMYLNHYSTGNISVGNGGGYLFAYQSMRSPIFYDYNNTGYYLNPASGSNLNAVTFQSTSSTTSYTTTQLRVGSGPQSLTGLNLGTNASIYMIQSTYSSGAYYKVVNDTATPIRIRHQVSSFDTGTYTDSIVIFNHNYWRGYVGILRSPEYPLDLAGQARLSGGYTTSDARLKENIRDNTVGLTELLQLRTRVFDWITDREILGRTLAYRSSLMDCRGFIAQEAELIAPELVDSNEEGDGCKSIDEGAVTAMLVKAIQEQQVIIDDLKSRIENLENN